jgi:multiple sugar transport system permease protein
VSTTSETSRGGAQKAGRVGRGRSHERPWTFGANRPGRGARPGRRGSGRSARDLRDTRFGWLYSAPAMAVFAAFIIFPTAYTFYVSLWKWNALNPALSTYLGLGNYRRLFASGQPSFLTSLWNSLYFTGGMVVGVTAISLAFALLVQRGGRLFNTTRLAVYLPHATPVVASSIVWSWMYSANGGLIDWVLRSLHLPASQWLDSSAAAMPAVLIYSVWHEVGFTTLVFLGGLTVISNELGEAARVDGATAWQEFWHITWPQLRPVTVFVIVITMITSMQAFTQFVVLANGGPDYATTTLSLLIYDSERFGINQTGYAAAVSVVLFFIIAFFTLVRRRTSVGAPTTLA